MRRYVTTITKERTEGPLKTRSLAGMPIYVFFPKGPWKPVQFSGAEHICSVKV